MARADVEALIPEPPSLASLRSASAVCTGCDLYKNATQTVFGEGSERAELMLVGEQPGDREDLAGEPFVGPAGRLLDDALKEAGIDRSLAYVTNAVKHFKWEARGKRRIHKKPNLAEIDACGPWLEAEIRVVKPKAL
ncbi:MAG: uracil-DNA glycosylase, partial [Actinomycetota bacterium]|nr:uracil-DNA glycosylase [Actinomycetota bacterium]